MQIDDMLGVTQWVTGATLRAAGFEPNTIALMAIDDKTAPVSGRRCRNCGIGIDRAANKGHTHWPRRNGAAYCWNCAIAESEVQA